MKHTRGLLAAALGLCFALPASAQYIGILQSAETMDRGTFKVMVAPIMVFGTIFITLAKGPDGTVDVAWHSKSDAMSQEEIDSCVKDSIYYYKQNIAAWS